MGRSSRILTKIAKAAGVNTAVQYEVIREALMRACYRGLLRREPEKVVADAFEYPPLPKDQEDKLKKLVATFAESPEFKVVLAQRSHHAADTWVRAEVLGGLKLWVDLGDMFVSHNCIRGNYEPIETEYLRSILKPGMRFADIGANIGWFTLLAASIVGKEGRVFSFEPRTNTFNHLKRSIADNDFTDRCETHNVALGAKAGEWNIGWSEKTLNPGGTWSVPHAALENMFKKTGHLFQRTKVAALDELVGENRIDVIKIDVEGAEPLAMNGASRVLTRDRPVILSEINAGPMQQVSQVKAADYVRRIVSLGYDCRELQKTGLGDPYNGETAGPTQVVNVVFVPR